MPFSRSCLSCSCFRRCFSRLFCLSSSERVSQAHRIQLTLLALLEDRVLASGEALENDLSAVEIDLAVVGEVSSHARQLVAPDFEKLVDGTLTDLKRRQVRQEVVTNEEDHEDPVINGQLRIELERNVREIELDGKILAQHINVEPDERLWVDWHGFLNLVGVLDFFGLLAVNLDVTHLAAVGARLRAPATLGKDVLTKDTEVGLVSGQAEHDEVGI